MLRTLHVKLSGWINRLDQKPKRQVWFNFWEAKLTFPASYFACLHYTHQNPVKHGLVPIANQYPFCSAAWFERTASPAQVKTIYNIKTDALKIPDEWEPHTDW
jgi:putative transposase